MSITAMVPAMAMAASSKAMAQIVFLLTEGRVAPL